MDRRGWRIRPLQPQKTYSVGEKVRYLRTRRLWSQTYFSNACGIYQGTISRIETDRVIPTIETVAIICRVFKISLSTFFEDVKIDGI